MEIMINEAFTKLTDVNKLDDHKKIFLAVVSEIYRTVPIDNYIFFDSHDLYVLTGIKRFDPQTTWAKKNHEWVFDLFDLQVHDYHNLGFKPKDLNVRHGYSFTGSPKYSVEITDEDAQRMWWYLIGVFSSREIVSDFTLRDKLPGYHAYSIDRSYIAEMNYRLVKRDYKLHD